MLNVIYSTIFTLNPVISLGSKIFLDEYVVTCLSSSPYPFKQCGFFLQGLDDKSSKVNLLVS